MVFVDIEGASYPSPSGSYWNEDEAGWCRDIVRELLALEVRPSSVAIITFYKNDCCPSTLPGAEWHFIPWIQSKDGRWTSSSSLLHGPTSHQPAGSS
ncbi:unnamed protein product [Heligmosomoides polygyrus]|uniref:DNA2/NAM7 helicase-like C-terminal domain-containing protein n=1 Tax=Heligmosomoides polygyrus TaxID=6339 RepID=A0A3P7XFA9_HELPZ|nr:unnamed protein product [Heligmosomoides polygyrus]